MNRIFAGMGSLVTGAIHGLLGPLPFIIIGSCIDRNRIGFPLFLFSYPVVTSGALSYLGIGIIRGMYYPYSLGLLIGSTPLTCVNIGLLYFSYGMKQTRK